MIGLIILIFVVALIMCGMAIRFLIMTIQVLIEKCHHQYQQYHLREPIKYNSLSRSAKNKWWSSNRYIHKLKMMSGVSIQENHQFNI